MAEEGEVTEDETAKATSSVFSSYADLANNPFAPPSRGGATAVVAAKRATTTSRDTSYTLGTSDGAAAGTARNTTNDNAAHPSLKRPRYEQEDDNNASGRRPGGRSYIMTYTRAGRGGRFTGARSAAPPAAGRFASGGVAGRRGGFVPRGARGGRSGPRGPLDRETDTNRFVRSSESLDADNASVSSGRAASSIGEQPPNFRSSAGFNEHFSAENKVNTEYRGYNTGGRGREGPRMPTGRGRMDIRHPFGEQRGRFVERGGRRAPDRGGRPFERGGRARGTFNSRPVGGIGGEDSIVDREAFSDLSPTPLPHKGPERITSTREPSMEREKSNVAPSETREPMQSSYASLGAGAPPVELTRREAVSDSTVTSPRFNRAPIERGRFGGQSPRFHGASGDFGRGELGLATSKDDLGIDVTGHIKTRREDLSTRGGRSFREAGRYGEYGGRLQTGRRDFGARIADFRGRSDIGRGDFGSRGGREFRGGRGRFGRGRYGEFSDSNRGRGHESTRFSSFDSLGSRHPRQQQEPSAMPYTPSKRDTNSENFIVLDLTTNDSNVSAGEKETSQIRVSSPESPSIPPPQPSEPSDLTKSIICLAALELNLSVLAADHKKRLATRQQFHADLVKIENMPVGFDAINEDYEAFIQEHKETDTLYS